MRVYSAVPQSLKKITLITPVYNEAASIEHFYDRVCRAVAPLAGQYEFEILFVNNASADRTLEIIMGLHARDERVKLITHSRNFGYQSSVVSGLSHVSGDGVVVIDVDCEDPPEMIPQFLRNWEQGYDIVYGERTARNEFIVIQWARKAFYRLTRLIGDWELVLDMAEFSFFSDRVRRHVLNNGSTFPYVRGELGYVGFSRLGIPYKREPRAFGKTHYSLPRMVQFAVAGIFTSSTFPLRLVAYVAVPLILADVAWLLRPVFTSRWVLSETMLGLHLMFFVGCFAALAIYISRTYKDVTARPTYIVDHHKSVMPGGWRGTLELK